MKILFINTGPWGTGSFTLIKVLTKELLSLGHQVKIFFPDANYDSIDKEEYYSNPDLYIIWDFPIKKKQISIPTFPLIIPDPNPRNPEPITFRELNEPQLFIYEEEIRGQLSDIISSYNPDVIECHHIWYPCWIIYEMGLKYLVTAHHSDQRGFRYDPRIQEKAISCAKGAYKIIAISEYVKNEVLKLYGVDKDKINVISNGYDHDVFQEKKVNKQKILQKLGISLNDKARIISFAGKISLTKGIDVLIRANRLLDPCLEIHFIVMGSGDISTICDSMDKNSYSLTNVHFIGQQIPEHVANIHNISLLSIMPSREEGFGIACLEAMACGLPVVVSRSGGPESFAIGEIVDVGSAEQLAEGIMKILKMPELEYQQLRNAALEKVKQFSTRAIVQEHITIYQSMLGPPNNKI